MRAAPPRPSAAPLLIIALVGVFAAACAGGEAGAGDAAPAEAAGAQIEVDKPETAALVVSTERTYTDPSRAADDREKLDIQNICGAMAACAREGCSDDAYAARVKGTSPKTPWGKLMVDHLAGADQHRACRRLVKLLKEDNLGSLSSDCAYMLRRCG